MVQNSSFCPACALSNAGIAEIVGKRRVQNSGIFAQHRLISARNLRPVAQNSPPWFCAPVAIWIHAANVVVGAHRQRSSAALPSDIHLNA
jgi:hypothetical protein